MLYQTVPANMKGNTLVRGQSTAPIKDFGCSDCFLQLRILTAGPLSFFVNIENASKGHTLH
jgi:hypothetical protein